MSEVIEQIDFVDEEEDTTTDEEDTTDEKEDILSYPEEEDFSKEYSEDMSFAVSEEPTLPEEPFYSQNLERYKQEVAESQYVPPEVSFFQGQPETWYEGLQNELNAPFDPDWFKKLSSKELEFFGSNNPLFYKPKKSDKVLGYQGFLEGEEYRGNLSRQKFAKIDEPSTFESLVDFAADAGEALTSSIGAGTEQLTYQMGSVIPFFTEAVDSALGEQNLMDPEVFREYQQMKKSVEEGSQTKYLSDRGWTKPFTEQFAEFWDKGEYGNIINYLGVKSGSTAISSFIPQVLAGTGTALALGATAAPATVVAGAGLGIAALVGALQSGSTQFMDTLVETKGDKDKALQNGLIASASTGVTSLASMGALAKLGRGIGLSGDKFTNFLSRAFMSSGLAAQKNAKLAAGAISGVGLAAVTETGGEVADEAIQQALIDGKMNSEALIEAGVISLLIGGTGKLGGAFNFLNKELSDTEIRKAIEAYGNDGEFNEFDTAFIETRKNELTGLQKYAVNLAGDQILLDPLFKVNIEESVAAAEQAAKESKDQMLLPYRQQIGFEEQDIPMTPEVVTPLKPSDQGAPESVLDKFGANPAMIDLSGITAENPKDVEDVLAIRKKVADVIYQMGKVDDTSQGEFDNAVRLMAASAYELRRQGKIEDLGGILDVVDYQVFDKLAAFTDTKVADAAAMISQSLDQLNTTSKEFGGDVRVQRDSEGRPVFKSLKEEHDYLRRKVARYITHANKPDLEPLELERIEDIEKLERGDMDAEEWRLYRQQLLKDSDYRNPRAEYFLIDAVAREAIISKDRDIKLIKLLEEPPNLNAVSDYSTRAEINQIRDKYNQAEKAFDQGISNTLSRISAKPNSFLSESDYNFILEQIYTHNSVTVDLHTNQKNRGWSQGIMLALMGTGGGGGRMRYESAYASKLINEVAFKYGLTPAIFARYLEKRAHALSRKAPEMFFYHKYGSKSNFDTIRTFLEQKHMKDDEDFSPVHPSLPRRFSSAEADETQNFKDWEEYKQKEAPEWLFSLTSLGSERYKERVRDRAEFKGLDPEYHYGTSPYYDEVPDSAGIDIFVDSVFRGYRTDPENAFDLNREVTFTKEDGTEVIVHRGKIYRSNPDKVSEQFSREQFLEAAGVGRVLYQKDKPSDKFQKMLDEAQSPKTTSEVVTPSMAKKPDKYIGTDEALKDRDQKPSEFQNAKAATKAYGDNRKRQADFKRLKQSDKSISDPFTKGKYANSTPSTEAKSTGKSKKKAQEERRVYTSNFVNAIDKVFSSGIIESLENLLGSVDSFLGKNPVPSVLRKTTKKLKAIRDKVEKKILDYDDKWVAKFDSQMGQYLKAVKDMQNAMITFYATPSRGKAIQLVPLTSNELRNITQEFLSENAEFSTYPEQPSAGDRGMRFNKKSRTDGALLFLHRRLLEKSNAIKKVNDQYGVENNKVPVELYRKSFQGMKDLLNYMSKNSRAMDFAADGVNLTPELNDFFFKEYEAAISHLVRTLESAKQSDMSDADKALLTQFEEELNASFGEGSDLAERIRIEKQEYDLHTRLMDTWGLKDDDLVFDPSRTDIIRGQILSNSKTGKYVIQLFAGADIRTLTHEQAHLLRDILGENSADLKYVRRLIGMKPEDKWGDKDANGELFEEKFAEWMENFATNWRQQPKKSRRIYGKIVDWVTRAVGQIKDPEELYASMNEERLIEAYGDNLKTDEHKEAIAREMINRTLGKWLKDPLADVISNQAPEGKTQSKYDLWHSYMLDRSWAIGQVKEAAGDNASKSIWNDPTWAFRQILGSSGKVYNYLTKGFYNPYNDRIDRLNEVIEAGGRYDRRTGKVFDANDVEVQDVKYHRNIHDMMFAFNDLEILLKDGVLPRKELTTAEKLSGRIFKVSKSERKVLDGLISEYGLKDPKEFSSFLYEMYKMKYSKNPAMKKSYEDLFKGSKSAKNLVDESLSIFQENLEHAVSYMKSSGILPEIDNIFKRDESLLNGVLKSLNKSSEFYKDVNGLAEAMVFITKSAVEIGDRNRAHMVLRDTIGKTAEPYMFGKELSTTEYRMLSDEEKKSVQLIYSINDKFEQEKEYWVYSPAIQQVFDSVNQDGYDSGIMGLLEVVGDVGAPFAHFQRIVITHGIPFLWRNPVRDVPSAAVQSRTARKSEGGSVKYLQKYLPSAMKSFKKELLEGKFADFGVSGDIPMSTFMRELTGGGFVDQFSDSQVEAYYSALSSQMANYSKTGTDFVMKPSAYQSAMDYLGSVRDRIPLVNRISAKSVAASESLSRNMEYEAAYNYFRDQGFDRAEARARATAEAVDLIDFAKVGLAMRHINKWVVFSNASMQGLWRTVRSFADDTTGRVTAESISKNWGKIAGAWFVTVVLPRLALRLLSGEEEDRDRMSEPAEVRDTFITVNLGKLFGDEGSSFKLRIPQPFEHSVMAAGVSRLIDKMLYKDDSAFTGYGKSVFNSFSPFTASSIYGPFELIPQLLQNKKFYTDTDIIPSWELEQDVSQRRGNKHFGPVISYLQDLTGWDARNIDFALKDTFAYFGSSLSAIDRAMGSQGLPPEQGPVGFTFDKVLGMGLYQTPLHDKNVRVILDEKGNPDLSKEYDSIKSKINKWWGLSDEAKLDEARKIRKEIQKEANQIVNDKRDKFKKSLLY